MYLIFIIATALLLTPLFIRGGAFHNHMVHEADAIFGRAGFRTWLEQAVPLLDNRRDFLDLVVQRGNCTLCVEVETSARHVRVTAAKADALGLPLWIVVPNRKVRQSVVNKLDKVSYRPGGRKIYILLLGQLDQILMNCFPLFSPANETRENRKKNGNESQA